MITLENEIIKASIHSMGAELHSLYRKDSGLEYMWNGNPDFWPRHSPVLFPIVGGLLHDSFLYKGEAYTLAKHGFARDMEFQLESSSQESVSFILTDDQETLKSYPFHFLLRISYKLESDKIIVTYEVENTSDDTMYFSIGTHPAFNVPVTKGTVYTDYYLEFSETETSVRHNLDGNILTGTMPYLENTNKLPLKEDLFYNDAVIFKDLKSDTISIKTEKNPHGIRFNFAGFPSMGIWAAKDAPFVCIEPWCGLPDSAGHNQKIEEKEGIISLPAANKWSNSWSVECF
ncbi:MAG: aldose 1-epimerase family protein [Sphingobacteriaceae bacterium]|nr:aldose 1-epimerase family protein [Sphingobacteriaceae bacterium]